MLVLTRKEDESVVIGDLEDANRQVIVKVLEIRSGRIRLGFHAADSVTINREEVWEERRSCGQPNRSPSPRRQASRGQMERWEDDGGEVASSQRPSIVHKAPSTKSEQK